MFDLLNLPTEIEYLVYEYGAKLYVAVRLRGELLVLIFNLTN